MNSNPPKHIVAAGMLVERGDEVLLVKTERRGWEFPGGQIEEGESVLDGVIREVREEANIVASADRLVGVYSNLSNHRVIFDFLGSWLSGDARIGEETLDVAWVQRATPLKVTSRVLQFLLFYFSLRQEPCCRDMGLGLLLLPFGTCFFRSPRMLFEASEIDLTG